MAKFTSNVTINTRWRNNDFVGAAGSTHTFPDAFYDEFLIDWAEQLTKGNLVITETPTTGNIQVSTLTVGDITLTGTATGNFGGGSGTYVNKTGDTMSGQLLVSSATTTTTVGFGEIIVAKGTSYGSITVNATDDHLHLRSKNPIEVLVQSGPTKQSLRAKSIGVNSSTTSPTLVDDGITFGDDVNLYRVSANALKTDDALEVVGSLTNGGTSVSLSTHTHAYQPAGTYVTAVSGTAPIVSSGGGTPAISITDASTSASGVVQLSDSVSTTSSVLAATPTAVKKAYDIATAGWEAYTFGTAGVIATVPRFVLTAPSTPASGTIVHSRIIPHRDFTVTNIAFVSTTAASVPTLIRFGIYTRSGTTFTLVARTASDTTIFNASNTKFTRALDTTGGYPATYTMIAGTEYFLSVIQVASSTATLLLATGRQATAANAATGVALYNDSGEADLVTPSTGSVSGALGGVFAEVS
jgi:hypothetical protein